MKAIILVAGMGTRLQPYTNSMPKCMTMVGNISILENQLRQLKKVGVNTVVLVVGYLGYKIVEKIGYTFNDMQIYYAVNNLYGCSSTSYSLYLGLKNTPDTEDDTFILEGDVFFDDMILKACMGKNEDFLTIVNSYNPIFDGSFVDVDDDGYVMRWIHINSRTPDFTIEDKYKTVNIHKISKTIFYEFYNELADYITNDVSNTIEDFFDYLLTVKKYRIKSIISDKYKWFEIDTIEDLKITEKIFNIEKER